ncbi:MAG: hypothetical protein WCP15_04255 [bacterium]
MYPKRESKHARIHEDQHQFNKLFEPFEAKGNVIAMMRRVVEGSKTPEETIQKLIHGLVKLERRWMGFDSRARDEILAHYKEGKKIPQIMHNLTELKLYDYFDQYKISISKIPKRVKEELQKEISEVFYVDDAEGYPEAINAQALEVDQPDILPYIDLVFKDEYRADLHRWTESITTLEKKGYTKDEIVDLLSQEPINSWQNLARRMRPKLIS